MLSRKVVTLLSSNMHLEDFPSNRTSMASSKIFQLAVTLCVCDYTPYYIPVLYIPNQSRSILLPFLFISHEYPTNIPLHWLVKNAFPSSLIVKIPNKNWMV